MRKAIAMVMAVGIVGVGMGTMVGTTAHATTPAPTVAQCTTSAQWVMGQQKAAHVHINTALHSNADALRKYPKCGGLSPQLLNVVVGKNKTVNADGLAVWKHWNNR
jgi:hypothetical protein